MAESNSDEITLKELINKGSTGLKYLSQQWRVIGLVILLGASIGLIYTLNKKTTYVATLTFALDDEKSNSGNGLGNALGLASSLGIDLGSGAGGAFSGANLMELMRSRTVVVKALLNPIIINNKEKSLVQYFIEFNGLNKSWDINQIRHLSYRPFADYTSFSYQQDSLMNYIYNTIVGKKGILSVLQKDKKVSIISIEVETINEQFSKVFTESVAKVVSEYYVETKSRKSRNNVEILQKQADSVRAELNLAISGVAKTTDNTFNLNPAMNVQRTPTTKRQIDVQANTAILIQLEQNLQISKMTLLKETPFIQIIDKPIMPLEKKTLGKVKAILIGAIIAAFLICTFLILQLLIKKIING